MLEEERFEVSSYQLSLTFSSEKLYSEFSGRVTITLCIFDPLNKLELDIDPDWVQLESARVIQNKKVISSHLLIVEEDKKATLEFNNKVLTYGQAEIILSFKGKLGFETGQGLYSANSIVATQFEPNFASRVFPCFDSPALRSRVKLTLSIPEYIDGVVANMPKSNTVKVGKGVVKHVFEESPAMPVYLIAFAFGELEENITAEFESNIDDNPRKIPVRLLTPKNEQRFPCDHVLQKTVQTLQLCEAYFNCSYDLPKLDIVAVPKLCLGGMENWGCILINVAAGYRLSTEQKQKNFDDLIVHEVIHQWIGNSVGFSFQVKEGITMFLEKELYNTAALPSYACSTNENDQKSKNNNDQGLNASSSDSNEESKRDASSLFNGSMYRRSYNRVQNAAQRLGSVSFRQVLRDLCAQHLHSYVSGYEFSAALKAKL
eukprot:gb/GECH01000685.1/.p1 GENE.gb/GECH01000685.1/~~gb/GECH01000685.1/.p1  ORF type:complete len:431 (+),score=112.09 gb/GECH01000685.1/:1-1293(+)